MSKEDEEKLEHEFVDALNLLKECASQFRYYEKNHRAKIDNPGMSEEAIRGALAKADVNQKLAERIETFLNKDMDVSEAIILPKETSDASAD